MSENHTIIKVGVGASAGGLEAIQRLVGNLNDDNGFAYFIVMHLAPDKESNLAEIISRSTSLSVALAENDVQIQKDHIYVIPPNMNMSISDNTLKIEQFKRSKRPHLTINYFLDSLAQVSHERSIGIVLSGTGTDGSLGLGSIKEQGGITFAQSVDSAQYSQMPYQAALTGNVDFVLPPEEIAAELNRLGKHFEIIREMDGSQIEIGNKKIISLLRRRFKIDFSKYKESTFNRRVQRRALLGGFSSVNEYYEFLLRNQKEQTDMVRDLLINVTEFFRDPEAFETLKENIYPSMIRSANKSEGLRVWVVGCSTGEEVYSIAISLVEALEEKGDTKPVKIFGTDIKSTAIKEARNGSYPESISSNVSQERLSRFFVKTSGGYEISKRIREMCVFAEHNVLLDPPFANMDLISCRNLMIYLETATQESLLSIFHYSLKPDGYLFLGKSETVGKMADLFKVEDSKYKIYSKR
jgi:two-component system CheB/CheR fusion protein